MTYMVKWLEFDEEKGKDVRWSTYFDTESEALKFAYEQHAKGFKDVNIKLI